MEQQKAMEYGSRKASSDVNPRNIYTVYMCVCVCVCVINYKGPTNVTLFTDGNV
jgi:hypothetical protein